MFQDIAFLASRGVPMAEARKLSNVRRLALVVALGEAEGGAFDWRAMRWKARDT